MTARASAPWQATAAYLYTLRLNTTALAWEYLRRNPAYRLDWQRRSYSASDVQAGHWGLRVLEDPARDGRDAAPEWLCEQDSLALLLPDPDPPADAQGFDVWALPGRKTLRHDGARLMLAIHVLDQQLRLSLAPRLEDGMACVCAVRPGGSYPHKSQALGQVLALMDSARPPPAARSYSRPTSTALLAMRDLQALDGQLAGASLREIAEVVFGATTVAADWHADSHMRAKVRRSVSRGLALMHGGYRGLLEGGVMP